jgi:ParB-like chromosome segregation protein Spo0J
MGFENENEKTAHGAGRTEHGLSPEPSAQERADIPLAAIRIDPAFNVAPRRSSDPELIGAMADSIAKDGLLQPLIVLATKITSANRPLGASKTAVHAPVAAGGWEFFLLAGFIRYAALKRLDWRVVPVVVKRELVEVDQYAVNDLENLRRTQVHPFYRAKRFEFLMQRFGLTCEDIAKRYGYSEVHVENLVTTYQRIDPLIRKEVFENLDVDESRIPAFSWLYSTSRKPTDEQRQAYVEKYGKGREQAHRDNVEDGDVEPAPKRIQRPRRRDVEQLDKLIAMLAPGAELEIAIQGFADNPILSQRERVLCKAVAYFAQSAKKPWPFRKPVAKVVAPVIPDLDVDPEAAELEKAFGGVLTGKPVKL